MVGRALARFAAATGTLLAGVALALCATPPAALAAPKAATRPTAVTISGKDIDGKLTVQAAEKPRVFNELLSEVNWLATAKPQTSAPRGNRLGPKYTVTVLVKDKPTQVYDLYPLAKGGPRAHRPRKQPTGRKADGWFYGRLTMSESLRISGVPLAAKVDVVSGGIGGGLSEGVVDDQIDPAASVQDFLAEMRSLVLLNGAVLVVILFGLAGIAFLVRRRV
jgi:hypothetical protein